MNSAGGTVGPVQFPVIVLAAGLSRRMGCIKAVLPVGGVPMIRRVVETCLASGCVSDIIVVTGHESSRIEEVLATFAVKYVFNSDYESGEMLSSVQAGVRALDENAAAFFLMPGDQPLVEASTFVALADSMAETMAPVVLPVFEGKRGHPVLISTKLSPEILALSGADTLKTALSRYQDNAIEVPVLDPGVVFDVDTREDYEVAASMLGTHASTNEPT